MWKKSYKNVYPCKTIYFLLSFVSYSSPSNGYIIPFVGTPNENSLIRWEKLVASDPKNGPVRCTWPPGTIKDFPGVIWKFPITLFRINDPCMRHASGKVFGLSVLKNKKIK